MTFAFVWPHSNPQNHHRESPSKLPLQAGKVMGRDKNKTLSNYASGEFVFALFFFFCFFFPSLGVGSPVVVLSFFFFFVSFGGVPDSDSFYGNKNRSKNQLDSDLQKISFFKTLLLLRTTAKRPLAGKRGKGMHGHASSLLYHDPLVLSAPRHHQQHRHIVV